MNKIVFTTLWNFISNLPGYNMYIAYIIGASLFSRLAFSTKKSTKL